MSKMTFFLWIKREFWQQKRQQVLIGMAQDYVLLDSCFLPLCLLPTNYSKKEGHGLRCKKSIINLKIKISATLLTW